MSMSDHSTKKLKKIKDNIHFPESQNSGLPYLGREVTACTAVLKSDDKNLEVEERVEDDLTQGHLINWCRTTHTIHPLKATGQGHQFLCAVSMALWSFSDAASLLCRFLFVSVSEFAKDIVFERWIRSKDRDETTIEVGFQRFINVIRFSSEDGTVSTEVAPNEFPQPLHIFITANVIRRPIVIIGDENDAHTGLYLPILSKPEDCTKWPLVFAVHNDLYFPLVNEEYPNSQQKKVAEFAIPLVSSNLQPIKIMFLLEDEENNAFSLLQKYFHTTELNLTRSSDICLILSAKLNNLPFEVAGNFPLAVEWEKQSSPIKKPAVNVVPSAPSASIVTLNNLSVSPCAEEAQMSILQETCRFPGCHLFVSRFTEPFCHEHVEQGESTPLAQNRPERRSTEYVEISLVNERCKEARCPHYASRFIYPYCYEHIDKKTVECIVRTKPKQNLLPSESSVVMEYCHHGNCKNYASQYIYPFCYEHLDDHSVQAGGGGGCSTPVANEPITNKDFDMSIMAEHCLHPNCNNHASKYTFPVCYEHLDSPLAITRAAAATRVVQLPHAGQSNQRFVNVVQQSGSPKRAPEVQGIEKKFEEAMQELETRTRNGLLCVKAGCTNFGNSRCRGYCHSCYNLMNQF